MADVMRLAYQLAVRNGINTLRTGDADLRLYAYKQFKYPVPNVLKTNFIREMKNWKEVVEKFPTSSSINFSYNR
jgi:hypothetical protein